MEIGHYMIDLWKGGGIATYIRRISDAQKAAGHTVSFFDRAEKLPSWTPAQSVKRIDSDVLLYQAAAQMQLDVLHVHTLVTDPEQTYTPLIRTLHGHEPYCPSGGRFFGRSHQPCGRTYGLIGCTWGHIVDRCGSVRPRSFLADFRRTRDELANTSRIPVLTVSDYLRREMLRAGYDAARVHALPLPAPAAQGEATPPPRDGVPRFVFLGRLTPHKGVDWLLKAMARVPTPIHLDIAGEGNAEADLRSLAVKLKVQDRVTFHGWIGAEAASQLLLEARALVFPSLWQEPAGLVSFEAAVNGRAVIASRVGGIPEMVFDGETGLLVTAGDVEALAAAIEQLATDWDLARRLGETGRNVVAERFPMSKHLDALSSFYAQAVERRL